MPVIEGYPPPAVRSTSSGVRARDVAQISRPHFWCLSFVAIHLGFVLATHRIVPRGDEIVAMANAALVAGPLLWLAVLSINDARDLETDRANPRKAGSPLIQGRITPEESLRVGVLASMLTVLAAVPLGRLFTMGTVVVVLLGWAYSNPPLQLKARAGVDVGVNAFVVGVMGPLGGWVATTGTIDGYPWPISVVGMMAVAALYLPTTVVDSEADRRAGVGTTAVMLGRRATFEIGFALWAGSAVLALALAATGTVIDSSLVPLHLVMTPVLLTLYRTLLKEPSSFGAVLLVAGTYAVPCAAFVLTYVESL
ncbi:MAG TPA: UbiA prenyltransferase family protein [Jiangellaceae bacterium]